MEWYWVGLGLLTLLVFFIGVGVPIPFALAAASMPFLFQVQGWSTSLVSTELKLWGVWIDYILLAVPMFVFMGELIGRSTIGPNLYRLLHQGFQVRGSAAYGSIGACAGFGAVCGSSNINYEDLIDRKLLRFMAKGHAYAWIAMQEAIVDANLTENYVSNPMTGIIVGAGGTSTESMLLGTETLKEKGIRRVGPYMVTKTMSNGVAACLATGAKIKGINYAISSACSTSAHCIGNAMEQIQLGKQDIVFAGGAEEEHWTMSYLFDAMGAMSSKYNDTPEKASRTYDQDRDGFVISGGAGILVLEEYEHAIKRGAKIYAEIIGYGATSDGHDMVAPSGQ